MESSNVFDQVSTNAERLFILSQENEPRDFCYGSCLYSDDGDPDFDPPTYPLSQLRKVRTEVSADGKLDIYYCLKCFEYEKYRLELSKPLEGSELETSAGEEEQLICQNCESRDCGGNCIY